MQVLARLLTPPEMERWETLTLQKSLDRMPDLVYCPRCSAATLEDGQHCAFCAP